MYYAMAKPIAMCYGFERKQLRDDWVKKQLAKERERYERNKAQLYAEQPALVRYYPEYTPGFTALTSKEAMKHFGRTNCWGEREIRIHRVIKSLDDKF